MTDARRSILVATASAAPLVLDLLRAGAVAWWPLYAVPIVLTIPWNRPALTGAVTVMGLAGSVLAAWLTRTPWGWSWLVPLLSLGGLGLVVRHQQRRVGELLHEAAHHARVLDVAGVLLVELDRSGRVVLINESATRLLANSREQIVGTDWFATAIPEPWRAEVREVHRRLVLEESAPHDYLNPVLTAGGAERLIAWHNTVMRDSSGRIVGTLSSGRDITDQRAVEEALRRSRKELEDLKYALDQADIVAATDHRGVITYVNDKFCDISRYSRAELLGQDHRIINSSYHSKEFIREMWRTIAGGRVWRGELRNKAKDGALYWVDTTIVPFLDDRGKPYQYMSIRSDITEKKRAEELLREQAALTRLGELAAVVAHEVRNPIAGAQGALQIIRGRLPQDGQDRAIVDEIITRFEGLNRLIEDILVYARPRPLRLAPTSIRTILGSVATFVASDSANRDLQLAIDYPEDPVPLTVDGELVKAVFLNLVQNAIQAMNGQGRVDVRVTAVPDRCTVSVRDRGPGVAPENRERIFEPFFTTRHRGTGLGLPIARRVVERHGGTLAMECPSDGGTIMTVTLPRTPAPPHDVAPSQPPLA